MALLERISDTSRERSTRADLNAIPHDEEFPDFIGASQPRVEARADTHGDHVGEEFPDFVRVEGADTQHIPLAPEEVVEPHPEAIDRLLTSGADDLGGDGGSPSMAAQIGRDLIATPEEEVWTIKAQLLATKEPLPSCWLSPNATVVELRRSLSERGASERIGGYGLALEFGDALTNRRIWDYEVLRNAGLYHGATVRVSPLPLRVLCTASADGTARIWSGLTGECMQTMFAGGGPEKPGLDAGTQDSSYDASATDTASVMGEREVSLPEDVLEDGHSPFSRGRTPGAYSGSESRLGSVCSLAEDGGPPTCASVTVAVFAPDDKRILTASEDFTAKIWDVESGDCLVVLVGHEQLVGSACFSPDGGWALTASDDGTAKIWDAFAGTLVRTLAGHGHFVRSASFSPDGLSVLTASFDHSARIWEMATGTCIQTLSAHGFVRYAAWSPDAEQIVTASSDHTANIWDALTGENLHTCRGHTGTVYSAVFDSTGELLVTASFDGTARVWNVEDGQCRHTLLGHRGIVSFATFSPISDMIVTVSHDHTAKVWDTQGGQVIQTLIGHEGNIVYAAWSQDGDEVVTTSHDGTAKVWRSKTGVCKHTLKGHEKNVLFAQFNSS